MLKYVRFVLLLGIIVLLPQCYANASYRFSDFRARPPIHVYKSALRAPEGMTPDRIKSVYNLPLHGGHGTIALIGAYDDPTIEKDLNIFSAAFNLPSCTVKNGCFEKHKMARTVAANSGWSLETSLDVEWAHAIAPDAKILLVEARTPSGNNLLNAVDYAVSRADVVAISMSWGGQEFPEEVRLDNHFRSKSGTVFFASSGDNGTGASWPASSPNVIAVGGTRLDFANDGTLRSETAWSGSGGGISAYEPQPDYQKTYNIPRAKGRRAIPDVSYNGDPQSGFPVYKTSGSSKNGWNVVGGTSAGAPQWAAIQSLGIAVSHEKIYTDKAGANHSHFFRDITSGKNGDCTYYCEARKHYDYVTGLGSPQTDKF